MNSEHSREKWRNHAPHVEAFVKSLDDIPWLRRLGEASPRDHEVFRIHSWDTWPGPEDPGAEIQSSYRRKWRNEVFGIDDYTAKPEDDLWTAIEGKVFALARVAVPYEEKEDAWHGPNAAVWSASWVAALVGCTIREHGALPAELGRQWTLANEWSWFVAGHWPCAYFWSWGYTELAAVERTHVNKPLVIY